MEDLNKPQMSPYHQALYELWKYTGLRVMQEVFHPRIPQLVNIKPGTFVNLHFSFSGFLWFNVLNKHNTNQSIRTLTNTGGEPYIHLSKPRQQILLHIAECKNHGPSGGALNFRCPRRDHNFDNLPWVIPPYNSCP